MDSIEDIPDILCKIVEEKTGLKEDEIILEGRTRKYVMARCIYTNLLSVYTTLTESDIAKRIKKDRATVYYMYKIHSNLISVDKPYMALFQECAEAYVTAVCNNKYLEIDIAVIMDRISKVEAELKELKELIVIKSYIKNDNSFAN